LSSVGRRDDRSRFTGGFVEFLAAETPSPSTHRAVQALRRPAATRRFDVIWALSGVGGGDGASPVQTPQDSPVSEGIRPLRPQVVLTRTGRESRAGPPLRQPRRFPLAWSR